MNPRAGDRAPSLVRRAALLAALALGPLAGLPVNAGAMQLHWSTGLDTLKSSAPTRGALVLKADVADVKLPTQWQLFFVGDSTNVAVQVLDSLTACQGDTANVDQLTGPVAHADSVAHLVTAQLCPGVSPTPTLARYAIDLPGGTRARFRVAWFDPQNPSTVAQTNDVVYNAPLFEDYTRIVALSANVPQAALGATVTFKAAVAPAPANGVSVTFKDGAATLGTGVVSSGVASFTTSALAVGTHVITAVNDTITSPPLSFVVTPLPTTSVAISATPSPSHDGQRVAIKATITPSTATGTVTFTDSSVFIGNALVTGGIATLIDSNLTVGNHVFVASYGGDFQNAAGVSAPLAHTVLPLDASVTTLSAVPNPAVVGGPFQLRASVTPAGVTGTVEFRRGTTSLGFAPLIAGLATLNVSVYCAGNNLASAIYGGDSTHYGSSAFTQWVTNPAATWVTVTSSLSPSPYTQAVHFIATLHDSAQSACVRSGTMQFTLDGANFGAPVALSGDTAASLSIATLLPGPHLVQATFSGNADFLGSTSATFTQSVAGPEPRIASVRDVTGDQGGQVKLNWDASALDAPPYQAIESYYILRSVPAAAAAQRAKAGMAAMRETSPTSWKPGTLVFVADPDTTYYWEFLASQPAFHVARYSYVAATTTDSMAGANHYTAFMVMARGIGGAQSWFSKPDSGYSVDNLAPLPPRSAFARAVPGGTQVSWLLDTEADVLEYRLYRGADTSFVPGPANLVAHTSDSLVVVAAGAPNDQYKLAAVDVHGNVSAFAKVTILSATSVPPSGSLQFALESLGPNPWRGDRLSAVVVLTEPAAARLELLDISGRRIGALPLASLGVGRHTVSLDFGRGLAPGLYLVRLSQGAEVRIRRVAVLQ